MFVNVYRQILSLQSRRVACYVCLFVCLGVKHYADLLVKTSPKYGEYYNGISCHGIKLQKYL